MKIKITFLILFKKNALLISMLCTSYYRHIMTQNATRARSQSAKLAVRSTTRTLNSPFAATTAAVPAALCVKPRAHFESLGGERVFQPYLATHKEGCTPV